MEVLLELIPVKLRRAVEVLEKASPKVAGLDIPESPVGVPAPNSVAMGAAVKALLPETKVFSHIRLVDVNEVALLSLIKAAKAVGIDGVVLTRGDPPALGRAVGRLSTEEALDLVRSRVRHPVKLGAVLSMRYDEARIVERMRRGFNFFLVLRLSEDSMEKYLRVAEAAEVYGVKLYPYVIVESERNRALLESLGQPSVRRRDVDRFIDELRGVAAGVIVSCPDDHECLEELAMSI